MTTEPRKGQNDTAANAPAVPPTVPRRRRLLGAATGGVGVLLAVQARTALGQAMCISMSGQMSGNTSPHSDHLVPCEPGFSPGFWRQPKTFREWWSAARVVPPTFKTSVKECTNGQGSLGTDVIDTPGTLVTAVFASAPVGMNVGIWEVIATSTMYDPLLRHLLCAWLNAGAVNGYAINREQILDMWSQLSAGKLYCPGDITCNGEGMDAGQVTAMIEATYQDKGDAYAPAMCSANDTTGGGKVGGGKKG